MVKIYCNRIRLGLMTIDDVPAKYRDAVRAALEA